MTIAHNGNVEQMMMSSFQPQGPPARSYWALYKNAFPKLYPIVSLVSKVPASSSSLERIFSEIGRKVGKDRTSLLCETLVILQQGSAQANKFMKKISEFITDE